MITFPPPFHHTVNLSRYHDEDKHLKFQESYAVFFGLYFSFQILLRMKWKLAQDHHRTNSRLVAGTAVTDSRPIQWLRLAVMQTRH
jgi:hypothetical protein